jgi:NitT/TauT family transport system ATP-binding protein
VGEVRIALPRPRDVSALATTDEFLRLYRELWSLLGAEVEKSYRHQDVGIPSTTDNHKEHEHETQA